MFKKIMTLRFLVVSKLVFIAIALFAPFSHPHIIRQNDTLGVAIRYWLRWFKEPDLFKPLYPALLQAGDQYGIHATEFPVLNILFAPTTILPTPWNSITARLLLLLLNLSLTYISFRIWKKKDIFNIDFRVTHLMLLLFGISGVFFHRFMPDYTAFILAVIALGLSIDKIHFLRSFFIGSLALLIKPPAVMVFAFIFIKKRSIASKNIIFWMLPAVLVTALYYTIGNQIINEASDIPTYFYSGFRNPLTQLISFFTKPMAIMGLIFKDIFSLYLLIFFLWNTFSMKLYLQKKHKLLWMILVLQILGGAMLDGDHAFIHDYYFISTSFVVAIIFSDFLAQTKWKSSFLLILFAFVLDKGIYSIRNSFSSDNLLWQCKQIKERIPNELKIRTKLVRFADLGTCLGVVQNSKTARFGVYYKENYSKSSNDNIIFETKDLVLVDFQTKS